MSSATERFMVWGTLVAMATALVGMGVAWGVTTNKVQTLQEQVGGMTTAVHDTRVDVAHIRAKIDTIHP